MNWDAAAWTCRAVFKALADLELDGWAIVEFDGVPGPNRSAKEAAEISKRFLTKRMNLGI